MKVDCPLCGKPADSTLPEDFRCIICGQFKMSFELQLDRDIKGIGDPTLKVALSAATRQENFFGNRTLRLTPENYRSHAETHRWTPVSQKFQMILEAARKSSAQFGAKFTLKHNQDYPLFDAAGSDEAWALIGHLVESQLMHRVL